MKKHKRMKREKGKTNELKRKTQTNRKEKKRLAIKERNSSKTYLRSHS
jgi:hypothetical protein